MTKANDRYGRCGFTIVELTVTIAIVSLLAATLGMFFAKLLNIRERDREEAYVRERLSGICASYADMLSVGTSIIASNNSSNQAAIVKYRQETGGVSMETAIVSRVSYLASTMDATNRVVNLDVLSLDPEVEELNRKFLTQLTRRASGDAELIPLCGDIVSCTLRPLGVDAAPKNAAMNEVDDFLARRTVRKEAHGLKMTDAALGSLEVAARYEAKDKNGETMVKTVTVGRVVRLWNRD